MLPNDEKLCLYIMFKLFLHVTVKVNFYMNTDMDKTETYFLNEWIRLSSLQASWAPACIYINCVPVMSDIAVDWFFLIMLIWIELIFIYLTCLNSLIYFINLIKGAWFDFFAPMVLNNFLKNQIELS